MAIEEIAKRIFERLEKDICDRKGLKHEWTAIDNDVMSEELRPAWEKIISEEVFLLLNTPKK